MGRSVVDLTDHEGHVHVDPVFLDLAAFDNDLLLLDPGAAHLIDGVGRAGDAGEDRVLEALVAGRTDFNDLGHAHGMLLVDGAERGAG